jgi:hypothetical protein
MTLKNSLMRMLIAVALLGCALPACDDSNDNDTPSEAGKGGSSGKGGSGGSGGSNASAGKGGTGGKGGSGGSNASAGKGSSGGGGDDSDAGKPTEDCKGVKDCVCSAPAKNEEFLNHCTEASCNPFDNSKLTKLKDGKLPAIP